jgi:hypothetical protein
MECAPVGEQDQAADLTGAGCVDPQTAAGVNPRRGHQTVGDAPAHDARF